MNTMQMKNRKQAREKVDKALRRRQILDVFRENGPTLTAREITRQMAQKGQIPEFDMNYVKPRLTEMTQDGVLKVVGKTTDELSGRSVSIYEETHARFSKKAGQIGMELWRLC